MLMTSGRSDHERESKCEHVGHEALPAIDGAGYLAKVRSTGEKLADQVQDLSVVKSVWHIARMRSRWKEGRKRGQVNSMVKVLSAGRR